MHRNGMTMFHNNVDYFFVTRQSKRTERLLRDIAVTMMRANGYRNVCTTDIQSATISFLRDKIRPATLEWKRTEKGRVYYNIRTTDGCVCGCSLDEDLKIYELEA